MKLWRAPAGGGHLVLLLSVLLAVATGPSPAESRGLKARTTPIPGGDPSDSAEQRRRATQRVQQHRKQAHTARKRLMDMPLAALLQLREALRRRHPASSQQQEQRYPPAQQHRPSRRPLAGRRLLYSNPLQRTRIMGQGPLGQASEFDLSADVPDASGQAYDYLPTAMGAVRSDQVADLEGYSPPSGYESMTPNCERILNGWMGHCMAQYVSEESMTSPLRQDMFQAVRPDALLLKPHHHGVISCTQC